MRKTLTVIVKQNRDGSWFGQGLEMDYAAQGDSYDVLRERFVAGLRATLKEHAKRNLPGTKSVGAKPETAWPINPQGLSLKRIGSVRNPELVAHGVTRLDFHQVA